MCCCGAAADQPGGAREAAREDRRHVQRGAHQRHRGPRRAARGPAHATPQGAPASTFSVLLPTAGLAAGRTPKTAPLPACIAVLGCTTNCRPLRQRCAKGVACPGCDRRSSRMARTWCRTCGRSSTRSRASPRRCTHSPWKPTRACGLPCTVLVVSLCNAHHACCKDQAAWCF